MERRALTFYSDGYRLDGILHLSKPKERRPVLMVCSGLHGLKEWVPAKWAPYALDAGFHCFAFDYRGFGSSEGERGRIFPHEEIRDTIHALDFLRTLDEVDEARIAVLGWGLGAGIAICAAAEDRHVAAVCAANGAGDYGRTVRDAVEYPRLLSWQERLQEDRLRRARTGVSEMVDYRNITNPDFAPSFELSNQFRKDISSVGQKPIEKFSLASCEAYMTFRPEEVVGRLSPRPFLIVHSDGNHYMPISEAHRLYEAAGPGKAIKIYRGKGHLEWISEDNPASREFLTETVGWLRDAVGSIRHA
jgi:pimeloyl-ACP methyl ester carboxylesterase